ncbi:ABC transporter permease [Tessaracoccus lapidicaptus]|uniref:ABC transporter permease n=1 Tax=Tessaracoccus lapidicaptus TaxID=1427523 RepID=UPI00333F5927
MTWLTGNWPQVLELLMGHLLLTVPAVGLSVMLALPLGRLAWRLPRVGGPLLAAATLLYAVPALPLLIVIPVLIGTPLRSSATMIAALTVYGVALLVRSVVDGFGAVDRGVRDAAVAVGHSPTGMLWRVDLPLALPVILAGVRVVMVSTVGLVTIGALIGVPSLGSLLTDGFQRGIVAEVVTGVVVTVALALILDAALVLAGKALTPWAAQRARGPVVVSR